MPTATAFNALGAGNGFPICVPTYDVTSLEYITLGGYKHTDAPTAPTQTQLDDSLTAAMKLYWNLYSIDSPTITGSATASASGTSTVYYEDDEGNEQSETVSASTSDSYSYSYPSSTPTVINRPVPSNRTCNPAGSTSGFVSLTYPENNYTNNTFVEDIGEEAEVDAGTDIEYFIGYPSIYNALNLVSGLNTSYNRLRRFMHNGVFVGYGFSGTVVYIRTLVNVIAETFPAGEEAGVGAVAELRMGSIKATSGSPASEIKTAFCTDSGMHFFLTGDLGGASNKTSYTVTGGTTKNMSVTFSDTNNGSTSGGTPPDTYTDTWNLSATASISITIPSLQFYTY